MSPDPFTVRYSRTSKEIELKNNIVIHLKSDYPFYPPDILIAGRCYKSYRVNNSKRIQTYLTELGYDCLCCCSIVSRNNWSPCYTIQKILEEINQLNSIKRNVKYKIAVSDISKFIGLPEDMNDIIASYLLDPTIVKQPITMGS